MKYSKDKKLFVKIAACLLGTLMSIIATPFLNQEFVTALADSAMVDTNVAYFEGMAPNMSDAALHTATRMSVKSSENPAITFFVHGQSGSAAHWSNNGKDEFAYDEDSLIEKLRDDYGGANVYWARMSRDRNYNLLDDIFQNKNNKEFYPYEENRFFLTKLYDGKYEVDGSNPQLQEFVTQLDDVSKHIIVVYESADPETYHREEYKGLHTIVDRLSYDYRQLTGKLPKVDFISHSRGGLTSMLYATGYRKGSKLDKVEYSTTKKDGYIEIEDEFYEKEQTYSTNGSLVYDHPYNVDCLYSIGTPYSGTEMASTLARAILGNTFKTASAQNILDAEIWSSIEAYWNTACSRNNELKLYACGGEGSIYYFVGMLGEERKQIADILDNSSNAADVLQGIDAGCDLILEHVNGINIALTALDAACVGIDVLAAKTITIPGVRIFSGLVFVVSTTLLASIVTLQTQIPTLLEYVNEYKEKTNTQDKLLVADELLFRYHAFLQGFHDLIKLCSLGEADLMNDIGDGLISTDSQLAKGYPNVVQYKKVFAYEGIQFVYGDNGREITYTYRNFDSEKRTVNDVAIPHNLETYDEELQGHIRDSIRMEKLEQLQGMTISLVSGSTTGNWKVKVVNGNKTAGTVVYNERMCFEDDAKNFHHLTNLRSFRLSPGGEKTVTITGFGTADYIALAFSYTLPSGKIIYSVIYANNLNASTLTMGSPRRTIVPNGKDLGGDLVPNYLNMSINKKQGTTWYINLTNTNEEAVSVTYNSKMCFDDAARNFYGLRDLVDVTIPGKSTKLVTISENLTATFITAAINYTLDGVKYRRITSANELSTSGTLRQRGTEIQVVAGFPEVKTVPNYITMVPVSRNGFLYYTWGIKISNPNSFAVEVSYNAKLCFEGDAKAFESLADIVTVTIPANSSKTVTINHNGTAGWIAASVNYSYNGYEYRRITYADGLAINPYRTNSPKHNQIRFT